MKEISESKYLLYDSPIRITGKIILRFFVYLMASIVYPIVFRIIHPKFIQKKYKVSIMAIFRDEAPYLKEWIEYHHLIGIEHFYLYNNFSQDCYLEVLKPYIDMGWVTLTDWPYKQAQMEAYADCVNRHSKETNWFGMIDLDEFVVPVAEDNIGNILNKFINRPVVVLQWKYFGTSGIDKRDLEGLVIEDFTSAWPKLSDIGKVFFNTGYDYCPESKQYMHVRWARFKGIKLPAVNLQDRICLFGFNFISKAKLPAQINHYLLKSKEEYFSRKSKRGGGIHDVSMHDKEYFEYHEGKSNGRDIEIQKYVSKLKAIMGRENK